MPGCAESRVSRDWWRWDATRSYALWMKDKLSPDVSESHFNDWSCNKLYLAKACQALVQTQVQSRRKKLQ